MATVKQEGHRMKWPQYPHLCAGEVTPEQIGIYVGSDPAERTVDNPHNITAAMVHDPIEPEQDVIQPMTTIDSSLNFDVENAVLEDAGAKARLALVKAKLAAGARRTWFWSKVIASLFILGVIGFGYYSYEHRVKTYVTDHRPCSIEAEDKSWKVTGTRSYTYQNNELFGVRWSQQQDVTEKTELDVGNSNLMVGGVSDGGYWWVQVTPNTTRPVILKPAGLYVFMANNKMLVTNSETFCK